MVKLEPKVSNALAKLNVITTMPTPQAVKQTEEQTSVAMKHIDQATDGAKESETLDVEHSVKEKGSTVVTQKVKTVETTEEKEGDPKLKEVEKSVQ